MKQALLKALAVCFVFGAGIAHGDPLLDYGTRFIWRVVPAVGVDAPMITSSVYNMPSSGHNFFLSFWTRTSMAPGTAPLFLEIGADSSHIGGTVAVLAHTSANNNHVLEVAVKGGDQPYCVSSSAVLPFDGTWHHVALSVDTSGGDSANGRGMHMQISVDKGTVESVDCHTYYNPVLNWSTDAGDFRITDGFVGSVAEVMMYTNGSVTIDSTLLDALIDDAGRAVGLGDNCADPLSTQPNMCHRGNPKSFVDAFTGDPLDAPYLLIHSGDIWNDFTYTPDFCYPKLHPLRC